MSAPPRPGNGTPEPAIFGDLQRHRALAEIGSERLLAAIQEYFRRGGCG